jgi:hypothetical protein
MKIENIDTTLEEIQEVGEQMRVINEAISQPVGGFQVCLRAVRSGVRLGGGLLFRGWPVVDALWTRRGCSSVWCPASALLLFDGLW